MRHRPPAFSLLVAVALFCGCSTYRQNGPPHFDVDVSFLDAVNFTYHRTGAASADRTPELVRVTLSGSGHIHYARGRSSRVQNSFWTEEEEKHVDDIFTDQIVIGKEEVTKILQALVDAGVFERDNQGNHVQNPTNEFVFVGARINERRGIVVTDDKAFVDIYKRVVRHLHR